MAQDLREEALIPNRIPNGSMESPFCFFETHRFETPRHEIYRLRGIDDAWRFKDEEWIDALLRYRSGKGDLRPLDNLGVVPPHELPSFFMASAAMKGGKTGSGDWSVVKKLESISTSIPNKSSCKNLVGAKTMMEFKPTGSTKAVVGMTRYNLLTTREDGDGLYLDEDLSLCHAYPLKGKVKVKQNPNGKRSRSGYAVDPPKPITQADLEELDQMIIDSTEYPPFDVDAPNLKLGSKYWQYFTKIYTKDKDSKPTYAACNNNGCNTMLKLTGGGTGSFKSHSGTCKHKLKQIGGSLVEIEVPQ